MDNLDSIKEQISWSSRCSGSRIALCILGLLSEEESHGYALKQRIVDAGFDQWALIKLSSLYPALNKLEEIGAIEGRSEKHGKCPECTVYSITDKGRKHLLDGLQEFMRFQAMPPLPRFYLATYFLNECSKEDTLRNIDKLLKEVITYRDKLQDDVDAMPKVTPYFKLFPIETGIEIMNVLINHLEKIKNKVSKDKG
jgi:DNA-binding PadR family transcriptional regulator